MLLLRRVLLLRRCNGVVDPFKLQVDVAVDVVVAAVAVAVTPLLDV